MYHIAVLVAPPQWNFGVIFHLNVDAGFTATAFAIVFSLIEFFNGTFFDSDLCSAAYTISFYLHHCTNTVINMQKKSFHKINIMYCSSLQALLLCTPQKIHFTNMKNESNVKLFVLLFSCAFFFAFTLKIQNKRFILHFPFCFEFSSNKNQSSIFWFY